MQTKFHGVSMSCKLVKNSALILKRSAESQSESAAGEKLLDATERAAVELLNGVGIHQELVMAVARKPLT